MSDIPRAVLSERFQTLMKGKVLKAGVFLTFRFDPGFFEQEILSVFLDIPLSHEPAVRLLQIEDTLRAQVNHLAVYYDPRGLEAGSSSAKLNAQRIPVSWPTGYFHPKNLLLLVQDAEVAPDGTRAMSLLVATLSANLTRAGWWENVEACHVEELQEGVKSSLRDDVLRLTRRVREASPPLEHHAALDAIRSFLRGVPARVQSTSEGVRHPRLYIGLADNSSARESVPDFLDRLVRHERGLRLEIIAPYLDDTPDPRPLRELIERFSPEEVRVLLPMEPDGEAACSEAHYDAVRKLPEVRWGKLPGDLVRSGASESAAPRRVHAKVYRFFTPRPRYEAFFIGSVNLTNAAHSAGGNLETGFLIEHEPARTPDWWLAVSGTRPAEFKQAAQGDEAAQGPGMHLVVSYAWGSPGVARALWTAPSPSPPLEVQAQGSLLFRLQPLRPGAWQTLGADESARLGEVLKSTSLLTVTVQGAPPATILVQEEGMAHKPSILLNLTIADILRCWASLTPEQKAVLLEERYQELAAPLSALMPSAPLGRVAAESFFDAFAGIFHAFGSLERKVFDAFAQGREAEAVYLLFGKKYDSLPRLIERVFNEEAELDSVRRYVILLCARQILDRVQAEAPASFSAANRPAMRELEALISRVGEVRDAFSFETPSERAHFLDWFERWFLTRATSGEGAAP